ncbi:MAG: sodium:proton antiporter [Firmicutes bacterium]|nr:sodium:proton antiporter [Bacillota bacterium]HOB35576.1 MnhB domain-containing protein [Bacillota bacterium]HPZ91438.1 MnhB domain-containing protein [Bacillota bacterium]HQE02190.1 MnhB domain-containing protein [Bacillota bacterium]
MQSVVLQTVIKLLLPFIQVYGLYIIFHGHISPGGGFAGGAVMAASFVLFAMSYGVGEGFKRLPRLIAQWLESLGGLIYIALGLTGILRGAAFLTNVPEWLGQAGQLFSAGLIPLLTTAIGLKVCSTIVTLLYHLLEEGHYDSQTD